jgi:KTSC domain
MKLQPVTGSTSIQAIGYDADAKELHVQFHSGTTYTYPGISPEQHQAFVNSDSKGRHFQAHIRSSKAKQVA